MATVNKNFKVKSGLIVEGATGTINGYDILTKNPADDQHIIDLIGGEATSLNTPDTVVKRDGSGNFAAGTVTANLVGDVTGNADTATALETSRTIELTGDVTGSVSFDGTANVQISTTIGSGFATDAEVATAKGEAIADAASYTDGEISTALTTAQGYATTAENNAKAYADGLASGYEVAGAAAQALADAEDYTDAAVANLVDGAPALLDTLNELAAAIADNPNYATDVANLVATKADTTYVDDEISGALTTAQGYADTAEADAKAYADGLAVNYDPAGSASTAQSNAETFATNAINALDTDDIEEGASNLYFTNQRAIDAVGGTVADAINALDTDDIEEGTSNLYFTDSRAQLAVASDIASAVAAGDGTATPEYLAVNLADLAKQVAAQVSVPTASEVTAFSWASAGYRSAEFLVKVAYGTHTEVSKVVLTMDSTDNIAITEYAVVGTNGSASTISADVSGSDVRLRVTTANNNSTVTVVGTLLV